MRKFGYLFFLLGLALLVIVGVAFWPHFEGFFKIDVQPPEERTAADFQKAKLYLDNDEPKEALEIVHQYRREIERNTEEGRRWLNLFIRASEELNDATQLIILYQYRPEAFTAHEKASLIVGDALILTGKSDEYEELRKKWKGRESKPHEWFVLDTDKLLLDGRRREAIEMLKSKSFEGKEDVSRLVRLALLHVSEDPKKAWDYLTEANRKDPTNPNIRTYRARLLEMVNKPELALSEYVGAMQADRDNVFLKDQLADFYIRQKLFPQALDVWQSVLNDPEATDTIWLKALFWSRIASPIDFSWSSGTIPQGTLKPLLEYLIHLKPWQFWDTYQFDQIPNSHKYLNTQQAAFWLRLLSMLKNFKEEEARQLLQFNPFSGQPWNPELELALKRILSYRQRRNLNLEDERMPLTPIEKATIGRRPSNPDTPDLFHQLNEWAEKQKKEPQINLPAELHNLLTGKSAFAAALLASGWFNAALEMQQQKVLPADYPPWVALGFTQALRFVKGNLEALEFATLQNQTPQLELLIGELMIAEESPEAGLEQLRKLEGRQDAIGKRATWLISLVYIDQGDYEKAKEAVNSNALLAGDVLGKEVLARIALLEGDYTTADQIYTNIEENSAEAKSYLARKAFAQKDWKRARELTISLLKEYPNNQLLIENMRKIEEELKKQN